MNPHRTATRLMAAVLMPAAFCLAFQVGGEALARAQAKAGVLKKDTSFTRPKPTQPIKPTIPGANRYQSGKVFLEYADSLFRPSAPGEEVQVVKGNVKFRQGGLFMFCDSAYYYPDRNSLDAFGHVKMRQGDTLFVYSDKLYYDGFYHKAILTHGPSQRKVKLQDPKMTLTTDSLDYDMASEMGWYTTGGQLEDDVNTLTSVFGQYNTATKQAVFRQDVLLVNNRDGYRMTTEELDYNTGTNIADIHTHTLIEGENDTIITTSGWYDTRTDNAELTSRSTIIHRDSAMNVTTLEGDSIIYDKATRISRAYMFGEPWKHPLPMVLTDTARKMTLIGGYGEYNDADRSAFATLYPLLMEYSRADTLYLRADTILTYTRVEMEWPKDYKIPLSEAARARLAAFHSAQELAESMNLTLKLLPDGFPKLGLPGEPSSPEQTESDDAALAAVEMASSEVMGPAEEMAPSEALMASEENSAKDIDSVAVEETGSPIVEETVQQVAVIPRQRVDSLGRDSAFMVPVEYRVAKAFRMARFFKQDMQGIADSIEYQDIDSMLYLFRNPIVWSDKSEIAGHQINVHLNDTTVDWAYLPDFGLMSEHVDEDFYNQLSGKEMTAIFENGDLRRLEVKGNVETVMLPMEHDSTYNRLVRAESSFMEMDMHDRKLDRLKMWPEVTGTVTPLFMVTKNSQKYLEQFKPGAHDGLRPVIEWYEGRYHWDDELGEVPDALVEYFNRSRTQVSRPRPKSPFETQPEPVAKPEPETSILTEE